MYKERWQLALVMRNMDSAALFCRIIGGGGGFCSLKRNGTKRLLSGNETGGSGLLFRDRSQDVRSPVCPRFELFLNVNTIFNLSRSVLNLSIPSNRKWHPVIQKRILQNTEHPGRGVGNTSFPPLPDSLLKNRNRFDSP